MDEYKSRLSSYLSDMVKEELEKYEGGYTDEWNDQRKKNAEVLGYKLSGKSDIKEGATEFWQDMFRPGNIPNQYINQLIKKKGELPSKKHIKKIYRDNGNPSSSQLSKAFKQLAKEKYIKKQGSMWKWESGFAWRTGTELESVNEELQNSQGEQTDFKKGDLVKDINPDCPHHGSEGEVTKVGKGTITFDVTNNGKNYQQGDELEKTVDQMVKLKESVNEAKSRLQSLRDWGKMSDRERSDKIDKFYPKKTRLASLKIWQKLSDRERSDNIVKVMNESVNEGFTKYHIRLTDTPGWYGVWDKKGKQKFEGDRRFVMKNLKKLKTRMGNFQLKSLIGVATKRKGKDIEFDVVESVNEYHKFRGKMTYGDKGIGEEGMYFFVDQLINAMEDVDEREFVSHMSKELGLDKKIIKRIWKNYDKVHPSLRYKWRPRQWEKWLNKQGITEDKKRDYKAEYKKFQSSTKAKKYRAELNQYNRKKGTYGNKDGKDASHKGGKIVGFEKESTNRGRREKSRLKKEDIREFSGDQGIHVYLGGIVNSLRKAGIKAKTAKQMKHGFSKSRDKIGFFIDVLDRKREKYTLQLEIDRDGDLWYLSAPKDIKLGKWADTSKVVRSLRAISKLPDFGQSSLKRI